MSIKIFQAVYLPVDKTIGAGLLANDVLGMSSRSNKDKCGEEEAQVFHNRVSKVLERCSKYSIGYFRV